MEYLFITSIGLLVFFFVTIIGRTKKKKLPEWIFMSWILLLILTEISFFLYAKGNANKYPVFISTIYDTHLLHPTFLYLYIKSLKDKSFTIGIQSLKHLVPLIILIITKISINHWGDSIEFYEEGAYLNTSNLYVALIYIYKYVVMLAYIIQSFKLVKDDKSNNLTENKAIINLWSRNLVKGTLILFSSVLFIQIARLLFPVQLHDRMLIMSTLATLFIYILVYLANNHTNLLIQQKEKHTPTTKEKELTVATISQEERNLFEKCERHVNKHQSYLNGMLTLKDLAAELSCPQRLLSQSINLIYGQSFTYYINAQRMEHLKGLLDEPKNRHFTILSLAIESGFNSKTTLVRIFKQHTGMTPSEYQGK